jgi:hypothetical protein
VEEREKSSVYAIFQWAGRKFELKIAGRNE